jgi:hypothetical protein
MKNSNGFWTLLKAMIFKLPAGNVLKKKSNAAGTPCCGSGFNIKLLVQS